MYDDVDRKGPDLSATLSACRNISLKVHVLCISNVVIAESYPKKIE